MLKHHISQISCLSRPQFRVYKSLRRIGFKPYVAYEIASEWFGE